MKSFHVIDTMIDAPYVKRQFYLPVWIKRITGVLFFPVIPIPRGAPDGNPLGIAALSLENEKVNVVTNMKVFKKAPCYYEGKDLSDAGGEIFLDGGYNGNIDFYACNDAVSPNSYALFKYTNRKIVRTMTAFEQLQVDRQRLQMLIGREVKFGNLIGFLTQIREYNDLFSIIISSSQSFIIWKSKINEEIYNFFDPNNDDKPFFDASDDKDFDEPYKLKIVLRHES